MMIASALHRLRTRAPGSGLGRDFYTDPKLYELDLNHIFYREWLFAAHSCELPATGSYVTLQVGAYPLVLVRAADGAGPRLRECLPPSRLQAVRRQSWHGGEAGVPLSPVDLRARRPPARRAPDGPELRPRAPRPEEDPLRERRRLHLCVSQRHAARVSHRPARSWSHTLRRTSSAKPAWPTSPRSSRRATGSSSGRTTASATTAAVNHPELGRVYPDTPTVTSVSGAESDPGSPPTGASAQVPGWRAASSCPRTGRSAPRACRCSGMR